MDQIIKILHTYRCPYYIENADCCTFDPFRIPPIFQNAVDSISKNYPAYLIPFDQFPKRISKITGYPDHREMLPSLQQALSPWFDVIIHQEYAYIEITLKGCSKGTGVLQIMKDLQVRREDSYAFGDSNNDIQMLEAVGHGIVMGDAPETLKQKYTVTDSIYRDGVANGLRRAGLI